MPDASPSPVSPYLTIRDAAAAIDFYRLVFGAEETGRHLTEDGRRIMHATVTINGGVVMLADEIPGQDAWPSPQTLNGTTVSVSLLFAKAADVDETYRRALGNGAQSDMEPQDPFWGGRFAMLRDPFGHRWMLSAPPES